MAFDDEQFTDLMQALESGLKREYQLNPQMTDSRCMIALDFAKIAVKQLHGMAKNERVISAEDLQGIIGCCVQLTRDWVGKPQGPRSLSDLGQSTAASPLRPKNAGVLVAYDPICASVAHIFQLTGANPRDDRPSPTGSQPAAIPGADR